MGVSFGGYSSSGVQDCSRLEVRSGCSSVGRASVFQTECREFEPRRPLQTLSLCELSAHVAQW
jgi:hypothetical protein